MSDRQAEVKVKEVYGEKRLVVSGSWLLGRTKEMRELVEEAGIDASNYGEGETVALIASKDGLALEQVVE